LLIKVFYPSDSMLDILNISASCNDWTKADKVRELLMIDSGSVKFMESKLRMLGHTSSISLLLSIPSHLAMALKGTSK